VTRLRRGGIFKHDFVANSVPSLSVKSLKIGKYLGKLWARVWCLVFLTHSVVLKSGYLLVVVLICLVFTI